MLFSPLRTLSPRVTELVSRGVVSLPSLRFLTCTRLSACWGGLFCKRADEDLYEGMLKA